MKKKTTKNNVSIQPEVNIGLVGHVDHGKTTLTEALSGKWADTHSEELKRGITIRLGYADTTFYKCEKCQEYGVSEKCSCKGKATRLRKISLIDAPGHETLMATMLSGAAIMDGAILIIAADEECPQPQTREHLMALSLIGVKNIIIVQNKIDIVSNEQAITNYKKIKVFVKGTIAESAPIIPISAQQRVNISELIHSIETHIKTPTRDLKKDPIMLIARSFDINKPGSPIKDLSGGVLGGVLRQGMFKVGDKVEIRPGRRLEESKDKWQPLISKVHGLKTGGEDVKEAGPGGSIGLLTELDPSLVKSNYLTGNIAGHPDKLPPVRHELVLQPKLLERVVGSKDDLIVDPIKKSESLLININSSATTAQVLSVDKQGVKIKLRSPICTAKDDRVAISRNLGARWRLIGIASVK